MVAHVLQSVTVRSPFTPMGVWQLTTPCQTLGGRNTLRKCIRGRAASQLCSIGGIPSRVLWTPLARTSTPTTSGGGTT